MKIYTEVNYQWVDGRLVEISSKSFDYTGNLTLCGGGGGGGAKGGGGGGGGGTLGAITSSVSDTVSDVATDPIGTTTDVVSDAITDPVGTTQDLITDTADTVGGSIAEGADIAGQNIQTGVEMTQDNLAAGTEGLAMNQGVATTISDMGQNIQTNMKPIVEEGTRWVDAAGQNIESGLGVIGEKAQELSDFIHNPNTTPDVALDSKGAFKGKKTKKDKKDLSVNKAKQRARKSLRIN